MKRIILASLLVAVTITGYAQDKGGGKGGGKGGSPGAACAADHEKFCKGIKAGDGRLMQCMSKHHNELSPDCQSAMKAMKARHEQQGTHDKGGKGAQKPQ